MIKKNVNWKLVLEKAVPIMITYYVMGIGCGLIYQKSGLGALWNFFNGTMVFSGTMQFAGISLIIAGTPVIATFATALLISARHIFYSISMIGKYKDAGLKKWYLLYALTDETYAIVSDEKFAKDDPTKWNSFFVSLFDQCAWVSGTVCGALLGSILPFDGNGLEFGMTAMFTCIFIEQWISSKNHVAAITGVAATAICRVVLGPKYFLVGAMVIIMVVLTVMRKPIEADIAAGRAEAAMEGGAAYE